MKDINGIEIKKGQKVKHNCLYSGGYLFGKSEVKGRGRGLIINGIHGWQLVRLYLSSGSKIEVI